MNPRPLASALFVLTAVFGELQVRQANGEETYPIKFRISQVGDQKIVEQTSSVSFKVLGARFDGEDVPRFTESPLAKEFEKEASNKKEIEVYREKVLKVEDSRVTARKRRYQKIQQILDKFPVEHLIDQDIAIDATGGEISCYREDGPEILGDEAAWLQEKFRPDVSLPEDYGFPQVPVKINEPWKIDCKEFALQHANSWKSEMVIDPEKSQGTGVLKRVYRRGSALYGVIRFKFQMPIEQPDEPQQVKRRRPYAQPVDDALELKLTPPDYEAPQFEAKPSVKELPEVDPDPKRRRSKTPPTTDFDSRLAPVRRESNPEKLQEIPKAKAIPKFVVVEITMDVPIDGSAGSGQVEMRTKLPTKKLIPVDELTLTIDLEATVITNQKWEFAQKK